MVLLIYKYLPSIYSHQTIYSTGGILILTVEETETQRSLGTFPRSKSWSVSHQYLFSLTLKFKLLTTMTCASNVRPFYLEFF